MGVSSNYSGGHNAGTYGANHAIDGDPATEWSSRGDGDKARVLQFEVVADDRIRLGPFTLPTASGIHDFPVDMTAKRLQFNVVRSSGGNTGAVEIEALSAP